MKGLGAGTLSRLDAKLAASELSQAVSRMSGHVSEIVFVDSTPQFGLRFYEAVPVKEAVLIANYRRGFSSPVDVCEEAAQGVHQLWLVRLDTATAFESSVRGCGFTAISVGGEMRGLKPFEVRHISQETQQAASPTGPTRREKIHSRG